VYYDLYEFREKAARSDTAIIRLEQLYPFPSQKLSTVLERHGAKKEIMWVQEEHKNYGAWRHVREWFSSDLPDVNLTYRGRPESASAASGRLKEHREQQKEVVESAFRKE
jgi:2-oxoglutarate dehydrogenase E1 component